MELLGEFNVTCCGECPWCDPMRGYCSYHRASLQGHDDVQKSAPDWCHINKKNRGTVIELNDASSHACDAYEIIKLAQTWNDNAQREKESAENEEQYAVGKAEHKRAAEIYERCASALRKLIRKHRGES